MTNEQLKGDDFSIHDKIMIFQYMHEEGFMIFYKVHRSKQDFQLHREVNFRGVLVSNIFIFKQIYF
jgi:hypothetical protein